MARRDAWRVGPGLLISDDEATLLWPAVDRLAAEWLKMGASGRLRATADLLLRWRAVVEARAAACGDATPVGEPASVAASSPHEHTTRQAADLLGVTPQRVRQLVARGDLDGRKHGSAWAISAASVAAYRRSAA